MSARPVGSISVSSSSAIAAITGSMRLTRWAVNARLMCRRTRVCSGGLSSNIGAMPICSTIRAASGTSVDGGMFSCFSNRSPSRRTVRTSS